MLLKGNRISDVPLVVEDFGPLDIEKIHDMDSHADIKRTDISGVITEKQMEAVTRESSMPQVKDLQKLKYFLRFLEWSMAIFGIFQLDNFYAKKISGKEEHGTKSRRKLFQYHTIYCVAVLTLFVVFFVRSVSIFFIGEDAGENFTFKIVVATWSFQITLNVAIMLKASHPRWGNQKLACQNWDTKVVALMDCLEVYLNVNKLQKILTAIFVVGCASILLEICLIPTIIFHQTSFGDTISKLFIAPLPINHYTKVILCVLTVYQSVAWIVPVIHMVVTCIVVRSAFKVCKKALRITVDIGKETNTYPTCLYRQRMLHLNITQCLELMDKDFQFMYANVFFTNIPIACFILYQILKTEIDALTLTALIFWLSSTIIFVTVATIAGAAVNNAVSFIDYCNFNVKSVERICI